MQRNYKWLKITTCMQSWGKLWTTRYERPKKPNCYFWRIQSKSTVMGGKAGYCTWPVNTTLPKQRADHLNHPSGLTPTLIPCKVPAHPHLGEWASKGSCYLFSFPPAASGAPVKPCLNLSGLLSTSVDLGGQVGFLGGSDSKTSTYNVGDPVSIPGWERSPGEGNGNHSSILAWKIPWTEEPGRLQSMGSHRVRLLTERLHFHFQQKLSSMVKNWKHFP